MGAKKKDENLGSLGITFFYIIGLFKKIKVNTKSFSSIVHPKYCFFKSFSYVKFGDEKNEGENE